MNDDALIIIKITKDGNGIITGVHLDASATLSDVAVAQMRLAEFLSRQAAQRSDLAGDCPATGFLTAAVNLVNAATKQQESDK